MSPRRITVSICAHVPVLPATLNVVQFNVEPLNGALRPAPH